MTSNVPYNRSDECSWTAEEVAGRLYELLGAAAGGSSSVKRGNDDRCGDGSVSGGAGHGEGRRDNILLSQGWSTLQASSMRKKFGRNRMPSEIRDDEEGGDEDELSYKASGFKYYLTRIKRSMLPQYLVPVAWALLSQLKEPLILMLLASAAVSLILGDTADAISIGLALLIVSLVAAIQEYRSERALEKLHNLVPPTCSVLRGGKVITSFLASDLVIGDTIVLSAGE